MVDSKNHILRRSNDCVSVCWVKQVPCRKHECPAFHLGSLRQRNMNCHLVAVKVRIERFTCKRMEFKSLSLDEHRLKRQDSQSVKGRGSVQHHRMLSDNLVQNTEHLGSFLLNKKFCLFDVEYHIFIDEFLHYKRLEKFQSHLCRKSALPKFQFRSDNNYRTTRIVNSLTQKVLAEPSLLAFQYIGNRLQRSVRSTFYYTLSL